MERLDVVAERVGALSNTFHRNRRLVLDKDDCAALIHNLGLCQHWNR